MLASGAGSRQNAMNSPACSASDAAGECRKPQPLARQASGAWPGRTRRQYDGGRRPRISARSHEGHDIAEIGAGVIGRQGTLRARGHDRVEEVVDAAMARAKRNNLADRYLPFHSSPRLANSANCYDTPNRIFSPPLNVMPGDGKMIGGGCPGRLCPSAFMYWT